jgi:hypothetical protein
MVARWMPYWWGEFGDAGAGLVGGDQLGGLLVGEVLLDLFPGRSRCQRCGFLWQVQQAAEAFYLVTGVRRYDALTDSNDFLRSRRERQRPVATSEREGHERHACRHDDHAGPFGELPERQPHPPAPGVDTSAPWMVCPQGHRQPVSQEQHTHDRPDRPRGDALKRCRGDERCPLLLSAGHMIGVGVTVVGHFVPVLVTGMVGWGGSCNRHL